MKHKITANCNLSGDEEAANEYISISAHHYVHIEAIRGVLVNRYGHENVGTLEIDDNCMYFEHNIDDDLSTLLKE